MLGSQLIKEDKRWGEVCGVTVSVCRFVQRMCLLTMQVEVNHVNILSNNTLRRGEKEKKNIDIF